jgi:hypothetical protein
MAVMSKRNAYLLSVGWWLAKRRLRNKALEIVTEEKPARRRVNLTLVLFAGLAGGAAYVLIRRRNARDNGWISYQPVDLNGKGTADVATAVPASPAEE